MRTQPARQSAFRQAHCRRQRGASTAEFIVVAPLVLLLGLGLIHYGLLFFAKNGVNYAAFEAARAGTVGNASIATVDAAYRRALIPLYGGGRNATELQAAQARVDADLGSGAYRIELLNPTTESFDDWNARALQDDPGVGDGRRVIPVLLQNHPRALQQLQLTRNPASIGPASGQNLGDAALLKLRIVHGYTPQVPVVGKMLTYLGGFNETDPYRKSLYDAGRLPIVSHVTMQMQSDAIESANASAPGSGNNGNPVNPGPQPAKPAPPCSGVFCGPQAGTPPVDAPVCNPVLDPNCNQTPVDPCPALSITPVG